MKWCVGITVDTERGQIYWTQKGPDDAGKGRIYRAGTEIPSGQSPQNRTDVELIFEGLPEPIDMEIDVYNLSRGFDVIATNPDANAESKLHKDIDPAWKDLTNMGLSPRATLDRLTFTSNMKEALSEADFIQENAPERPDFKIKLFAEIDDATPSDSIIASSSSGNNTERQTIEMQASRARPNWTSFFQSSAPDSFSRGGRREIKTRPK